MTHTPTTPGQKRLNALVTIITATLLLPFAVTQMIMSEVSHGNNVKLLIVCPSEGLYHCFRRLPDVLICAHAYSEKCILEPCSMCIQCSHLYVHTSHSLNACTILVCICIHICYVAEHTYIFHVCHKTVTISLAIGLWLSVSHRYGRRLELSFHIW